MLMIGGLIMVFVSIIGGFMLEHGDPMILIQPAEIVIIAGAGISAFVASNSGYTMKLVLKNIKSIFFGSGPGKKEYLELLGLLFELFSKMYRDGIISIEKDIEHPDQSGIFQKYASVSKNKKICFFIGDTLRVLLTSGGAAAELDKLMAVDIQVTHDVENMTPHNISRMAESMPGMGIVAAVLGVVLTMGKINAPPEELGHAIGAALVGTFLGILLCYGVFGPMAAKLENLAHEEIFLYRVIREAVAASARGSPPIMALEFGRRAIPHDFRPTFLEMEEKLRG